MKKKYQINIVVGLCTVLMTGMLTSCKQSDSPVADVETEAEQENAICYQWQEITFTMPAEWKEKYVVCENENGVNVYHKASYEKDEGMGYLFGVIRSEDWLNYGTGEQMLAYTDDGMMYYLTQPTDVATDVEDDEILSEYMDMEEKVLEIAETIQIDVQNIHYDAKQYVIPISNSKEIEQDNLSMLSDNELWIAENEIYARHGKVFDNDYLQCYFDACSWYAADDEKDDVKENELSEIEKRNLDKILQSKQAFTDKYPYPKQYNTDTNVQERLTGTDELYTISYSVTTMDDENECLLTIDDMAYDLSDFVVMENPVTDVFYVTNLFQLWDPDSEDEDGLEIAVLEYGPSDDLQTHFFKFDGTLYYIGAIAGFPFKEMNQGLNGFNNQGGVTGIIRADLLETAYFDGYWWYDSETKNLTNMDMGLYTYHSFTPHELLVDLPVYTEMKDSSDAVVIPASQPVFFLKSDLKEWIYVRAKDGTEGYIHVKEDEILNNGMSSEKVFADLYYFD